MKNRYLIGIITGFAISLCLAWTYTLDRATPLGTQPPSILDDSDREIKAALIERMNVDHYLPYTGTQVSHADAGYHRDIHFYSTTGVDPILDFDTVSGIDELRYTDSGGKATRITSNGTLNLASADIRGKLANDTYFTAIDNAGTGTVNLIKASTADVAVLPMGSELSTSDAPTADADIAHKRYVDDMTVVVQEVYSQESGVDTGATTIPWDDTIPQKTEGDEYLTLAITPVSATNILRIQIVVNFSCTVNSYPTVALFQDNTDNALATQTTFVTAGSMGTVSFVFSMAAGTTSETTFKVRIGPSNGYMITFNGVGGARKFGGVCVSSITITEYEP